MFIRNLFAGICSTLSFTSSELYRYPYRSASEAFGGDWKRIGKDITSAIEELELHDESAE